MGNNQAGAFNESDDVDEKKKFKKIDELAQTVNIKDEEIMKMFHFENLVFSGGGSKGLAYCGAAKKLEELGLLKNITRFGGASAGAIASLILVLGYTARELEEFLGKDLSTMFFGSKFYSKIAAIMRFLTGSRYGMYSTDSFYKWLVEIVEKKGFSKDITFKTLYHATGKELCVIVTNVNEMTEEYFHVKTTPNIPVCLAVQMSMSIPGLFQAVEYTTKGGVKSLYIDGGVTCNYPIHCFDGWWLSMKKEDLFIKRLENVEDFAKIMQNRFKKQTKTHSTLGFIVYADNEGKMFRPLLEERHGTEILREEVPDTPLARKKIKNKELTFERRTRDYMSGAVDSIDKFLKTLRESVNEDGKISRECLEAEILKMENQVSLKTLFGEHYTKEAIIKDLELDKNNEIDLDALSNFIERKTGRNLLRWYRGFKRQHISGVVSFIESTLNVMLNNSYRIFQTGGDIWRTVGINTGHVGTTDFDLHEEDKIFLVKGEKSTEAFLKYFIAETKLDSEFPSVLPERQSADDLTNWK